MKIFFLQVFGVSCVCLFCIGILTGCKKNPATIPATPPVTLTSACRLKDETKIYQGNYEHYSYVYLQNGKLDSVYYSQYAAAGNIAWCKEGNSGFLWVSYVNTDGKTPDLYDYLYEGEIVDSTNFPASLQTSFQLSIDNINTPAFAFNFTYTQDLKLQDVTELSPPPNVKSIVVMGITYTLNGDVATLQWRVLSGPPGGNTVTATGYDGHPTPYTGITGWVFLNPAVGWESAEYDPLLYSLSAHNPTGSTFGTGSNQYSESMTYTYNAEGYPITRTVLRTNNDGSSFTYTHSYDYDCK